MYFKSAHHFFSLSMHRIGYQATYVSSQGLADGLDQIAHTTRHCSFYWLRFGVLLWAVETKKGPKPLNYQFQVTLLSAVLVMG